jgi:hypothetical protein
MGCHLLDVSTRSLQYFPHFCFRYYNTFTIGCISKTFNCVIVQYSWITHQHHLLNAKSKTSCWISNNQSILIMLDDKVVIEWTMPNHFIVFDPIFQCIQQLISVFGLLFIIGQHDPSLLSTLRNICSFLFGQRESSVTCTNTKAQLLAYLSH